MANRLLTNVHCLVASIRFCLFTGACFTYFFFIHGFCCNKKARFVHSHTHLAILGVQKLTRSSLNGVSERETNFPFSRLLKVLCLRGENCLQNAHFYKQKGPCLKRPLNWTGSVFPLPTITGACFTRSLPSCEYIHSDHANSGHY